MTEATTMCVDGAQSRYVREANAYNLLGVAMDTARQLAAVLRETGCQGDLVKYAFPSPIVTDRGPTSAWAIIGRNGAIGLTYLAADGQLYCHDRDDMVAVPQGGIIGFERQPHYVLWYRHLSTCVYSPEWVRMLQEVTDRMGAALSDYSS